MSKRAAIDPKRSFENGDYRPEADGHIRDCFGQKQQTNESRETGGSSSGCLNVAREIASYTHHIQIRAKDEQYACKQDSR